MLEIRTVYSFHLFTIIICQVYEGKWVDDAPVYGEYRDPIQDEFTLFGLSSLPEKQFVEGKEGEKVGLKPLPVLELCNPDEVLTAQQKGKE